MSEAQVSKAITRFILNDCLALEEVWVRCCLQGRHGTSEVPCFPLAAWGQGLGGSVQPVTTPTPATKHNVWTSQTPLKLQLPRLRPYNQTFEQSMKPGQKARIKPRAYSTPKQQSRRLKCRRREGLFICSRRVLLTEFTCCRSSRWKCVGLCITEGFYC